MFYISVYSGLSNKLIPLITLLRIARNENQNIKCFWDKSAYQKNIIFHFNDLFIPIKNIEFIDKNEYLRAFNDSSNKIYNKYGSDRDRDEVIFKGCGDNNTVFNYIVHSIGYYNDNTIGVLIPTPKINTKTNNYIDEIRLLMQELKPIHKIQEKIEKVIEKFKNQKILGIHIRTTDGGFKDIDDNKSIDYIKSFINDNPDWKIFLASDNIVSEKKIIDMIGDHNIFIFDKPFGNKYEDKFDRSTYGVINGVCDLFILSKCDKFIGTPGSSFSYMTWLLRNDDYLYFWCENPWK